MPKVHQLIYISTAVDDLSYTDIREILEVSRRNNARDNITGVLIYREGYFLQILEGDKNRIHQLVETIKEDDRNYKLRVLIEGEIENRLFDTWSMAFLDGDISPNTTEDLIELFDLCLQTDISQKTKIGIMVRKFRASAPDFQ